MLENESRRGCSSANGDSMWGLFTDFSIELKVESVGWGHLPRLT